MPQDKKIKPTVFISSTVEDLKSYRQAARDAALRARFYPEMQEYFAAEGVRPPLNECLKKVDECDLLVVIVAYRYGWIPAKQPKKQTKSITWLECERAKSTGKDVIAFMVDPKTEWSETLREEFRLAQAMKEKKFTTKLAEEVQQAMDGLEAFKAWLDQLGIRSYFTTPQDLESKIVQSLYQWRSDHTEEFETVAVESDPQFYLQWLHDECAYIDIRGLQVGTGKAHKFGIEEIYIPLTTTADLMQLKDRRRDREIPKPDRRIELHQALPQKYVTIIGDPGAGKTTFLRRIAFALCQSILKLEPDAAEKRLGLKNNPFPIFIRLGELANHIQDCMSQKNKNRPTSCTDPSWLAHFLTEKSQAQNWGLSSDFFLEKLKAGEAILLLDGLDEAPDRHTRENISELVARAMKAYAHCPFVVTSRPQAYEGRTVLQDFHHVKIDPLEEPAMASFLWRWSEALFHESETPQKAESHHRELMEALRSRAEIRRMASNPVMLTALAVVHWNERTLPEQRADLYESIITWLLRSREQRPGRMSADNCVIHLQNLALAMQLHSQGRQVQVGRRWAAEAIQEKFDGKNDEQHIAAAERFLAEEEVDSGIVIERGNHITFWHLTFQEFLAAKALGGKVEDEQQKLLIRPSILHHQEWREVLLLFGGVLYRQGLDKVDGFFSAILDTAAGKPGLADQARCVGLIGAMLRDLTPFKYQLKDQRYHAMLQRVMAIFDLKQARAIPNKVRLEAADTLGQAGDPRLSEDNMILIPAGSFLMGAQKRDPHSPNYDSDAFKDESPVHEVYLSAYKISRYLVTVEQYKRFMDDGGYEQSSYWEAGGWKKFDAPENWEKQLLYPNRPVVSVSWYEAMAFARWADMELPTEAQWERAARGPSKIYRRFPWGNQPLDGQITNCRLSELGHASPIGIFPDDCTEKGVLDMGGNVWEWCRDWKDVEYDKKSLFYKKSRGRIDPLNDENGEWGKIGDTTWRIVRGGSWYYVIEYYFRCASRGNLDPDKRFNSLGFRLASSAQF